MTSPASTIGPVGDDTSPGIGPIEPTGIYEPISEPDAALAYSEAIDIPDPRASRLPAVAFATALVALAGAGACWFVMRPREQMPAGEVIQSAAPAIPAPAAAPAAPGPPDADAPQDLPGVVAHEQPPVPPAAPPPPAAIPDPDDAYLAALRDSGIIIIDPAKAVAGGRAVCAYLRQGHSEAEAVALGMRDNPAISPLDAIHAVTDAVLAYCPEMNRRH